MANRDEIIKYANEYLGVYLFDDYGPQGAQFIGSDDVDHIVTAVSATGEVLYKAGEMGAQMILVHHGLFWNTEPRTIDKRHMGRLHQLERKEMSLLGYHLCLDAHPEIGNNILALRAVGATNPTPFCEIGWGGDIDVENVGGIVNRICDHYQSVIVHRYTYGVVKPKRIAVMTGGGANYIHQAKKEGYDVILTGEPAEPSKALAKELGISFIAAGHYATEKDGIKALGDKLAKEFEIKHTFIDVVNYV